MNKIRNFLLISAFIVLGTACSSGGGGGGDAEITDENLEELATAGTEGIKQAVNNQSAPLPFARTNTSSTIKNLTVSLAQTVSQNPKLEVLDLSDICENAGGSVTFDGNENGGTIVYASCVIGGSTVSGTAKYKISESGDTTTFTIEYIDFTITFDGVTETLDLKATCTITSTSSSCTYDSEALGIDGRTYEVTDISVSGDSSSGYTIGCVVDDPDHGDITITTTTPITFNCSNGQPDNGVIVMTDGDDNTATITFIDCNNYSVDFNSTTTTFTWL